MESGDNQTQIAEQQNGTSSDEDSRKLFVGGLSPTTTKDDLQIYFEAYGEVEVCTIKTDVYTGRSRGFGFVIFKDVSAVDGVLNQKSHELCGKTIDPKLATPQTKSEPAQNSKIFVGGLDKTITKEDIEAAFKVKGNVTDVYLPLNRDTGEPKNFAFVNFDDKLIADELCEAGKFIVGGKECDVKRANNKSERGGFRGRGFRGGFRGRGGYGGRGGYYAGGYDNYASYGGGYASPAYGYSGADYNGGGPYANYAAYDQNQYAAGY